MWRVLREKPDVPRSYIWKVALSAARDSLARSRSVDRPMRQTAEGRRVPNHRTIVSIEAIREDEVRWRGFESRLVGMASRGCGQLPCPTEGLAVARVMCQELRDSLTPRQRAVFDLRLQEWTRLEIRDRLRLSQTRLHSIIKAIQAKTRTVWEEPEVPICHVCRVPITRSPHPGRQRIYCSNACTLRASRQRKKREASKGIPEGPRAAPPGLLHSGQEGGEHELQARLRGVLYKHVHKQPHSKDARRQSLWQG